MMFNRITAAISALCLFCSAANAAEIQSLYTDLNLDECLVLDADDFGASFACPGYKGYPLWVAEGDLRFFVSYGFGAPNERAATQTLPGFNYVHSTIEWRLTNESGRWQPFATILRWIVENEDPDAKDDEILVVTKIAPGNTCHVAYIDTGLTDNANERARELADGTAADFDCATDDIIYVPS